jgi:hypothetical protein
MDSAYFEAYPRVLVYLRRRGTFWGTFGALFAWHFKKNVPWANISTTMPPTAKRIADMDSAYFEAYPRVLVYLRRRGTFWGTFGALFA